MYWLDNHIIVKHEIMGVVKDVALIFLTMQPPLLQFEDDTTFVNWYGIRKTIIIRLMIEMVFNYFRQI